MEDSYSKSLTDNSEKRRLARIATAAALWTVALLWAAPGMAAVSLISTNADWRFLPGTNEASLPDTAAWRLRSFGDSAWELKPATFYYGEVGFIGTELTGMRFLYTSFFLRKTFFVADPASVAGLSLNAVCDDGFVAWINGTPAASFNPPTNGYACSNVAPTYPPEPVSYAIFPLPDPASCLVAGENVLAIQVFNYDITSSDIVFDAELNADFSPDVPLGVLSVVPDPGPLTNLTSITVTFTDPVTGVQAGDLLLNGIGATNVTGGGATYVFSFPRPSYGTVQISWAPQNQITTVTEPPRTLQPSTPGVTWAYELVSSEGPVVAGTHPRSNGTVRVLTQVEVWFDQPVLGVDAGDLLINRQSATNVTGFGPGPYVFQFAAPAPGQVAFDWAEAPGIVSASPLPRPFTRSAWQCTLDPQQPLGDLVINEFLSWNLSSWNDEDGERVGWIELYNRGDSPVDLADWALTDALLQPGKWAFQSYVLPPKGFLTLFASGKDRRIPGPGRPLHTNFKLGRNGEYLGLYSPDSPRQAVCEFQPCYPEQGPDFSFGLTPSGQWRYLYPPTPDQPNAESTISNRVEAVHFSVGRGFYATPFHLTLSSPTLGAIIRYTLDGSLPSEANGVVYTAPILIDRSRIVRAAAFKKNHLTSPAITQTYFYNIPASQRLLPALSIVTASNNLYGTSGIMETNPRNTTQHGIAWERPASAELIRPGDNGGFQVDCGLRIAGGDYVRTVYDYRGGPYSKYSFRLYFRGDYGSGKLQYPLFLGTTSDSFDTITLRAGMNDPTNPFIRDELLRQLESDAGLVASHGTFVNLFINGEYEGYYNPTERIDEDFLQAYHGGGRDWEIIDQTGEATEGTRIEWDALRQSVTNTDLTLATNYLALGRRMDLTNFVDYLLPHLYANTGDWPYNNWRAARERVTNGIFRFYAWDTEWSFGHSDNSAIGYSPSYTHNTITNQLSSTLVGVNMPWGWAFIQETFNQLKVLPEFKLLFADRIHKHLFNGGALTDENIRDRHDQLQALLAGTISNFDNSIATSWIPNRRPYLLSHLNQAGFLASSNAPVLSQFGGRVPNGFSLSMSCASGAIYYTTNGADPRVMFSGALTPEAAFYSSPLTLTGSLVLKARTLDGTNWSALTEAAFQVEQLGLPLRITEIMYNPVGGDAYEFIELQNLGGVSINLQDFSFTGIDFRFPVGAFSLAPGARLVLASAKGPVSFAARYPDVEVAGYFAGSLSNGGEGVALLDPTGQTVCSVDYDDVLPWPIEPDGLGYSLEIVDPLGDADDPANWHASAVAGGSPGQANSTPPLPLVRLNEIMALNVSAWTNGTTCPDWLELYNSGPTSIDLTGWSLSDDANPRKFVFPAGTVLPSDGYLVVSCDSATNASGLHTGFQLDSEGETVVLSDAATSRVDVVTFGPQVADLTVGRLGADRAWQLCEPTPKAPNEPAQLGAQASLVINEFMASALVGQDDWLELHNLDAARPIPLRGLYLGVSNAVFQLLSPGFVPPSGFVQLHADAQPGPNHLDFKLPASGGALVLSDAAGTELDRLTYGSQLDGVSAGRLPNGTGSLASFPGSASPGASNYVATWTGPLLNEVLARNEGAATNAAGQFRDWMELYNPNAAPFDLSGLSLSVGKPEPGEWVFPAGAMIPASGYLLVWCDASTPPTTNAGSSFDYGQALNAEGDALYLFNPAGQIVDSVQFGFQLRDLSIGRSRGAWRLLAAPTPGASNAAPAALGDPANVRLNEWMAGPRDGSDWLELFNPDPLPADLAWLHLTDDPSLSGQTNGLIGQLTFIAPHGFVKWIADNHPENGPNHLPFSLDDRGESLRLFSAFGQLLDAVDLLPQPENVSEGRWPDGAPNFARFVTTATPGRSNYLPLGNVVLNELLTHTDPPLEDAIEVRNVSPRSVDLSGWFLSDSDEHLTRYRVPNGTVIPPGGYHVFYENQWNPAPGTSTSFELDSAHGGTVYLSEADAAGNLTGFRSAVTYGASANGVSFVRQETSVGVDFPAALHRTFGSDAPQTLAQFRTGGGLANAAPFIGPVVITEIMYHPVTGPAPNLVEDPDREFVELHNLTDGVVPLFDTNQVLNTWHLEGGVAFTFPTNTWLAGGSNLLVVPFDPQTQTNLLAAFRSKYRLSPAVPLFGPYQGRLANEGEALDLLRPDPPQGPGRADAGFVPYLIVDHVNYSDTAPWPWSADGTGDSLQRRAPQLYGNEPLNWQATLPTPGVVTVSPLDADTDGDGMPDVWEDANGLDRLNPADAYLDPDGDGLVNLQEFISGTNPRDATSNLTLEIASLPDEYRVRFFAQRGCSYTIQYTGAVGVNDWLRLVDLPAQPVTGWVEIYLSREGLPGPYFFRLVTPARR